MTFIFLCEELSKASHIQEEGVAIKVPWIMHWSCLHYLPILYHRKTKLQIMLSNWVSVSTKTPYVSKFTICFISITIRLLPMSIHFLIYDNTPSHNSPICITPSPSPPLPPLPPINPTAMATPHAKDYRIWASIHGLFLFNDCISWLPVYYWVVV